MVFVDAFGGQSVRSLASASISFPVCKSVALRGFTSRTRTRARTYTSAPAERSTNVWIIAPAAGRSSVRQPIYAPQGATSSSNESSHITGPSSLRDAFSVSTSLGCPQPTVLSVSAAPAISWMRVPLQWTIATYLCPQLALPGPSGLSKSNLGRVLVSKSGTLDQLTQNTSNVPDVVVTTSREAQLPAMVLKTLLSKNGSNPESRNPLWIHMGPADLVSPSLWTVVKQSLRTTFLPNSRIDIEQNATIDMLSKKCPSLSGGYYDVLMTHIDDVSLVYVPKSLRTSTFVRRELPLSLLGKYYKRASNKSEDGAMDITFVIDINASLRFQWNSRRTRALLDDITTLLRETDPEVNVPNGIRSITIVVNEASTDVEVKDEVNSWINYVQETEGVAISNETAESTSKTPSRIVRLNGEDPFRDEQLYVEVLRSATHVVACTGDQTYVLSDSISLGIPTYIAGFKATWADLRRVSKTFLSMFPDSLKLFAPSPYVVPADSPSDKGSKPDPAGFASTEVSQDNKHYDRLSFLSTESAREDRPAEMTTTKSSYTLYVDGVMQDIKNKLYAKRN